MSKNYDDENADRRQSPYSNTKEQWHLSKSVNLSMIASILVLAVGGFNYIDGIDDKAHDNTVRIEHLRETQQLQNGNIAKELKEMKDTNREQYRDIKRTLEKLVDRELNGK